MTEQSSTRESGTSNNPVWFITGCSTGFGREIAKVILDRGGCAVVTARDPQKLKDIISGHEDRALSLSLDVTNPEQVRESVGEAKERFGRIDVLVNNAGYGYYAAIEEGDEDEIRAMFDANFFGLLDVTRVILAGMRKRRSGYIVNISSVAGLIGRPGAGYYAASKFAVEGASEALSKEVGPLGIKVMLVEPGPFRTDFAGRSIRRSQRQIEDYASTAGARIQNNIERSGRQPGDPERAAQAIVDAVDSENSPLRLLLGESAPDMVREKLAGTLQEIEDWEKLSISTNFPTDFGPNRNN